ncbi:peptidase M24 [Hoylesella timonensis]|uniref:Peptidase M24 n=2 Tax=Hoylesella timonensis TaxID=386414 RepID=A0A2N6Q410_9BACT|nr:aminopeptidase P family protein [Hoylesella timonensis]PMC08392.1 peptidase M24 [Hoylesella timonensis]
MKTEIAERLSRLRKVMKREHLGVFIFPSTDAHNSEYVPDHWKGREWISGFDGSAGVAVVTQTSAALWTDSRYFIAAEAQLQHTEYQLMRIGLSDTPSIAQWIGQELQQTDVTEVGMDGFVNTKAFVQQMVSDLRKEGGITLRTNFDPLAQIWNDRPAIPKNKVEIHPLQYAGESTSSKLTRIRKALRLQHADGIMLSALDDIAWTLNLRGTDVHCNPVFVAYLLISTHEAVLYVDPEKLTEEVQSYLKAEGVSTRSYDEVTQAGRHYPDYTILLDAEQLNAHIFSVFQKQHVITAPSPVPAMKAVKNKAEIAGFKAAMERDGVAMVKFLKWLKPAVEAGGQTEISLDEKLAALRAEQDLYRGLSFDTIVGFEAHGAIVHYEATAETDIPVQPKGLVLIDSGAQYLDGTTDITRTIALGPLTEEQRRVYTLVLKGHIQLELCKFPAGASGTQLDALARQAMWREGMNFMHGTGHGVGSYLNVHEGPHQIRMEYKPAPLRAGMTVTDEPGLYLEGKFGVRIENTLLITPYLKTAFGEFLQFEPLTLAPIDTTPIIIEMLLPEERNWLNAYHEQVFQRLSPYLSDKENDWLREATQAI